MKGAALYRWAPLLLPTLPGPASGHPGPSKHPSQELQTLQDLLEEEPGGEEGEMLDYGAGEDEPGRDLAVPENSSPPPQPQTRDPVESRWRNLLASPRRTRHLSGCFGDQDREDRLPDGPGVQQLQSPELPASRPAASRVLHLARNPPQAREPRLAVTAWAERAQELDGKPRTPPERKTCPA